MVAFVFLVLIFAAVVRLLPLRLTGGQAGVDQWTWKAIIDEMRNGSALPVRLDKFILDEEQWYPPLFQWLMGKLPAKIYDNHSSLVSIFLDLLRACLVMVVAGVLSDSLVVSVIAGVVYAITPLLITYNMQLNPRGMAALFFDLAMLGFLNFWVLSLGVYWLAIVSFFMGLILISHKMTTQLLVFMVVLGSLFLQEPLIVLSFPVAVLVALVLTAGYYRFVAIAHWDIVRFWFFNWRWSGSNPILESPVYGESGYESPSKFYKSGWLAWLRRMMFVVGFNPWVPIVILVAVCALVEGVVLSALAWFFLLWMVFIFVFSVATTLIPYMRCFGQGYLYGYNSAFPAAVLMGLLWQESLGGWYFYVGLSVGVLACLLGLIAFFKKLLSSRTMRVDVELNAAIQFLKELPDGVVMCLPQHWHDAVAYQTNKRVLFGGHGYGFRLLQPIFPRLLVPVKELIEKYDVRYLLTYKSYCNERFLSDLPVSCVKSFGDYQLYVFSDL